MTITIKLSGVTETLAAIKPLPEKLQRQVILGLAQLAFDDAQRGAARHNKTGALVASLFNRAIPNGREVGHDTQRAPQALFVNFGTKPHVIRQKNAKVLRFPVGGGRWAFAKQVNHPGTKADPYLFNAADAALRQFDSVVQQAFDEATK